MGASAVEFEQWQKELRLGRFALSAEERKTTLRFGSRVYQESDPSIVGTLIRFQGEEVAVVVDKIANELQIWPLATTKLASLRTLTEAGINHA